MKERTPSPSVYGIETEYSCMITLPDDKVYEIVGSCHSVDAKLGLYTEPQSKGTAKIPAAALVEGLRSMGIGKNSSGMLTNGGRFYIDPSGPEYDTPETATAEEAVHRTFEGDEVVLGIFEYLREKNHINGYQLNRRIVDHNRSSRGIHLNTTTTLPAEEPSDGVKMALATANVVKGALFGSGGLLLDEKGQTAYHHSPRLSITSEISATYGNYKKRPLVRYPFKPDGSLARVETVTADALNFAWPIRANLVVTNAVLQMIEHGIRLPILRNPVSAATNVGRNGNANRISMLKDGGYVGVRPLDILRQICETALLEHDFAEFLDKESQQVLGEVIDIADRMTADPLSVASQVESIARKVAMDRKMERDGIELDSEKMCRFDYAWDHIGGGIAETLRRRSTGWHGFDKVYSPKQRKHRLTEAPVDTRAYLRGGAIKSASNPTGNSSDWGLIDFNDGKGLIPAQPLETQRPKPSTN